MADNNKGEEKVLYLSGGFDLSGGVTDEQRNRVRLERIDRLAPHWFKLAAFFLGGGVSAFLCLELLAYLSSVTSAYQAYLLAIAAYKGTAQLGFDWHMLLMGWAIVLALAVVVVATMRVVSPNITKPKDGESDVPSVAALKEVLELIKSAKDSIKD